MNTHSKLKSMGQWFTAMAVAVGLFGATVANAQNGTKLDVYGFAMLDMGYQTKQNDPAWFDVLRPTKLPSFDKQYGEDGRFFAGVRQTRLGVRSSTNTEMGELKTIFEFELFGVGVDAGQTTLRLRHAYGELGQWGFGQTWSPFMDINVFPNSVEYWGPNGMAFFRNVQARWMPIKGEQRFATIALERPGGSGDQGVVNEFVGGDLQARFPLPDLSGEYHVGFDRGYVELGAIVRQMTWDDLDKTNANGDLSGEATGWGLNLSSNLKVAEKGIARLGFVYGEGIQNYMNDATVDVAAQTSGATVEGKAVPMTGISAFLDWQWNEKWSSTIGYSMLDNDLTDLQAPDAFQTGQYGLGNLMFYPVKNVMMGGELQWGDRQNKDGYTSDDFRVQFSAKYNFSGTFGGN